MCFVALTYILEPPTLGEQKSKAAQLGIKQLMQLGIQPDIIACRATNPVSEKARQKISIYSNVPLERVFSHARLGEHLHDPRRCCGERGLDFEVLTLLKIEDRINLRDERKAWATVVRFHRQDRAPPSTRRRSASPASTPRCATATRRSSTRWSTRASHLGCEVKIKWIDTTDDHRRQRRRSIWPTWTASSCPGGFGARGTEGKIACVQYARENNLPYLGMCLGFQMAVIEFARHVCGLTDANTHGDRPDVRRSR